MKLTEFSVFAKITSLEPPTGTIVVDYNKLAEVVDYDILSKGDVIEFPDLREDCVVCQKEEIFYIGVLRNGKPSWVNLNKVRESIMQSFPSLAEVADYCLGTTFDVIEYDNGNLYIKFRKYENGHWINR